MSTQRKFWIGVGAICLLTCCAAILRGCWYGLHKQREEAVIMGVVALLMLWIGHAIACALRDNPET